MHCQAYACEYFGGVPRQTTPDNLLITNDVLKNSRMKTILGRSYSVLAAHYDMAVVSSRGPLSRKVGAMSRMVFSMHLHGSWQH